MEEERIDGSQYEEHTTVIRYVVTRLSTFVIYGCGNLDLVLGRNRATASHGPLVRMHRWYAIHVSLFSTQTMCGQELIAFLRMEARARIIGVYMCW